MNSKSPFAPGCGQPFTRWLSFTRSLACLTLCSVLALSVSAAVGASDEAPQFVASSHSPLSPDISLGQLFNDVQAASVFTDQKTFADAVPRRAPAAILADYLQQRSRPGFRLRRFVELNFDLPRTDDSYTSPTGQSLAEHIDGLWTVLTRPADRFVPYSSLLPLSHPYVVPGGRFREAYYWDTYFTMLGLAQSGRWPLIHDMLDNFADQLDRYGHIPNGNRSYYLSRSQPPVFALMVELYASHAGNQVYIHYLPQLREEYAYWMAGAAMPPRGRATGPLVRLADGSLLNRYWDDRSVPRPESYLDDLHTARSAPWRSAAEIYRDLRAGAASGWDFSSRWLDNPNELASIRTTAILPIDLNSLLYQLELTLAHASELNHDTGGAQFYALAAARRRAAIEEHLWHQTGGYYADYDWQRGRIRDQLTAAALVPLFVGLASPSRSQATAEQVRMHLLGPGGLLTSTIRSGQQWDAPNGWAPLQWMAIQGLRRYHQQELAQQISDRFLATVCQLYGNQQKLVEKYVVDGSIKGGGGGGGEYPLQDGFGWTNGVVRRLIADGHARPACTDAAHIAVAADTVRAAPHGSIPP